VVQNVTCVHDGLANRSYFVAFRKRFGTPVVVGGANAEGRLGVVDIPARHFVLRRGGQTHMLFARRDGAAFNASSARQRGADPEDYVNVTFSGNWSNPWQALEGDLWEFWLLGSFEPLASAPAPQEPGPLCGDPTKPTDTTPSGVVVPCDSFFGFAFVEAFKTAPGSIDSMLPYSMVPTDAYGRMDADAANVSLVRRIEQSVVSERSFVEALAVFYLQGRMRAWMRVWRSDGKPLTPKEVFSFGTFGIPYALEQSDGPYTASHRANSGFEGIFATL
jgi:hypothetical protein